MMPSPADSDEFQSGPSNGTIQDGSVLPGQFHDMWQGIEFCPIPALLLDPANPSVRFNRACGGLFQHIRHTRGGHTILAPHDHHVPGTTIPLLARDLMAAHGRPVPLGGEPKPHAPRTSGNTMTWTGEATVGAETRILEVTAVLISRSNGSPAGAIQYMRDRTGEEELRSQLTRCQKAEFLGAMSATMAHQFNNSLMIVQGYIDLMLEQVDPRRADPVVTSLLKLDSSCRGAIHMTREILEFARHRRFRRVCIDLNLLLLTMRDFLGMILPGRITLEILPASPPVRTMGDPDLLKHAILNLVTNARDAIRGEGRIGISLENAGGPADRGQDGPVVRLVVEDSGEGIPTELRDRIFNASFTTRPDGNGLGLFAVKNIVESHGGEVRVRSTPGVGTRFEILLPALLRGSDEGMV